MSFSTLNTIARIRNQFFKFIFRCSATNKIIRRVSEDKFKEALNIRPKYKYSAYFAILTKKIKSWTKCILEVCSSSHDNVKMTLKWIGHDWKMIFNDYFEVILIS